MAVKQRSFVGIAEGAAWPPGAATLGDVAAADAALERQYAGVMRTDRRLTRQLVSFQDNKTRPAYRWYKYKEGFAAALVAYMLDEVGVSSGTLLDPFAGSGAALFVASERGMDGVGIELLPIGVEIITARLAVQQGLRQDALDAIKRWAESRPWRTLTPEQPLQELRITRGAYPPDTALAIRACLEAMEAESPSVRQVLRFALLCVLEAVSYTRKDGQYLRWDHRAGRRIGAKLFDKGRIPPFDEAFVAKLREIIADAGGQQTTLFSEAAPTGSVSLLEGSCLDIMPTLPANEYDVIFTSPPYCNRYDYTRTYALELALLGVDEAGIGALRQAMLTCTVESRGKELLPMNEGWERAINAADSQALLQLVLSYLEGQKLAERLNNNGIPRMVRGYFYEMACIIAECHRVLKPGGVVVMVNDNVRYAGASVSVDLILSDIARKLGFDVQNILLLPNGKGNSSQQMGAHGREVLRKCVYVWRKVWKMNRLPAHLRGAADLVTPHEAIRAGFVALVLEKNRRATPAVEEGRALMSAVSRLDKPEELIGMKGVQRALLQATGISDKAAKHLDHRDKDDAVLELIEKFLIPAGQSFAEELVYRFLLTKGDALGGQMRNVGGEIAERQFTTCLLATIGLAGWPCQCQSSESKRWVRVRADDPALAERVKALSWVGDSGERTALYNRTVPFVRKNVDFILLSSSPADAKGALLRPGVYLAMGELKGGIDPAGADEHWKTAGSALRRVREGFLELDASPLTFFAAAAIVDNMADEIWERLGTGEINNAANLTNQKQLSALCRWLCQL